MTDAATTKSEPAPITQRRYIVVFYDNNEGYNRQTTILADNAEQACALAEAEDGTRSVLEATCDADENDYFDAQNPARFRERL